MVDGGNRRIIRFVLMIAGMIMASIGFGVGIAGGVFLGAYIPSPTPAFIAAQQLATWEAWGFIMAGVVMMFLGGVVLLPNR